MGFAFVAAVDEPRVASKDCIGFSCLCEPASYAEHDAGYEIASHFDLAAATRRRIFRRLTLPITGGTRPAQPAVGRPVDGRVRPLGHCQAPFLGLRVAIFRGVPALLGPLPWLNQCLGAASSRDILGSGDLAACLQRSAP